MPSGDSGKVKAKLEEKPDITWHRAVRLIVDPDALEDEHDDDSEDANDLDDEDLSDGDG